MRPQLRAHSLLSYFYVALAFLITAARGEAGGGQRTDVHEATYACVDDDEFTWAAWGHRRAGRQRPPWHDVGVGIHIMTRGGSGVAGDGFDELALHAEAWGTLGTGAAGGLACDDDGCSGELTAVTWGPGDDGHTMAEWRRGGAVSHCATADGARGNASVCGLALHACTISSTSAFASLCRGVGSMSTQTRNAYLRHPYPSHRVRPLRT